MNLNQIIDKKYSSFSLEDKKLIHKLYHEKKNDPTLRTKLEKIVFRLTPPSPSEYLDYKNGWVTKPFQESIYPYIKEDFLDILNPEKNYLQVVEYGATRLGKSFLVRMLIHYIIIYLHCLRHPQLYYNLSPTTNLSIYIMSFVAEKVNQLLLDPLYKIFDMCPRMKKIHLQDKVKEEQYKEGLETIVWSKAGTGSKLTLDSQVTLNIGTDFLSFIGSDLLFLSVSEINFFIQQAGITHEEIFQLYTDGLDRIKATVGNNYLGMIYLDSSANDADNPIEKYINNDLKKEKGVFFRQRSRWEARPYLFPEWQQTNKTFKIYLGNSSKPGKIIKQDLELKNLNSNLLMDIPIDVKSEFEKNFTKSVKDICGKPSVRENTFINDSTIIDNLFNNPYLENIEGGIIADAGLEPKDLLWNMLNSTFFSCIIDNYKIKRASKEPRWIGIDKAYSNKGDLYGICMLHKELSKKNNNIIHVVDFNFVFFPSKEGINLSAIEEFIMDLKIKGGIYIVEVLGDSFESGRMKQNLKRKDIIFVSQSVDKTLDGYQTLYTSLLQQTVKTGKNIFLKNNLKSLSRIKNDKGKEIIDHTNGKTTHEYFGDWDNSLAGVNDKDVSDALTQALWRAENSDILPVTIYEEENQLRSNKKEDIDISVKLASKKLQNLISVFSNK